MATTMTPKRARKWGRKEDEFPQIGTKVIITRCAKCEESFEGILKDGRSWFKKHSCA